MKYIRTKDGVYELKENMFIENGVYSFFGKIYNTSTKHLFRNDKDLGEFVSQADTLEELCDAVVRIRQDKNPLVFNLVKRENCGTFEVWLAWCKRYIERIVESVDGIGLYGAIYTDKGLIYVAKLNDKGELELI